MSKTIVQIENVNVNDLKKELIDGMTEAFKGFLQNHPPDDDNSLLSREETATLLSVSLVTLWQWTRKDIIQAYRIGNKVRYKKKDVLDALQKMNKF